MVEAGWLDFLLKVRKREKERDDLYNLQISYYFDDIISHFIFLLSALY